MKFLINNILPIWNNYLTDVYLSLEHYSYFNIVNFTFYKFLYSSFFIVIFTVKTLYFRILHEHCSSVIPSLRSSNWYLCRHTSFFLPLLFNIMLKELKLFRWIFLKPIWTEWIHIWLSALNSNRLDKHLLPVCWDNEYEWNTDVW